MKKLKSQTNKNMRGGVVMSDPPKEKDMDPGEAVLPPSGRKKDEGREGMTLYICDQKKCVPCQALHPAIDCGCRYTSNPDHAKHKGEPMAFERTEDGNFWEVKRDGEASGTSD